MLKQGGLVLGLFAGLSLLLHAPDLLLGTRPTDPLWYLVNPPRGYLLFSLDLFGLFVLLALAPVRWAHWVRPLIVGGICFLFAYRTYDAVVLSVLRRDPILYADLSHVVGAVHLLLNGGIPWLYLGGLTALGVGLAGAAVVLPRLVHWLHRCLHSGALRIYTLGAAVVVAGLVGVAVLQGRGLPRPTYQTVCYSTTECVVRNGIASAALGERVARRRGMPLDSAYAEYANLCWAAPPSLYLVVLESYGSTLTTPDARNAPYHRLMGRVADSLTAAGWHAASAHSESTVYGGLSWLSLSSLLTGRPIATQPAFEVLRPTLAQTPHLPRTLEQLGYRTATLQPPVRPRRRLPVRNPYGFDHTFFFEDLNYDGPRYGWGIVPDQYSLSVAHDQFVERASGPFFLLFETVDPHAPWDRPPPPFVDDPAWLNTPRSEIPPAQIRPAPGPDADRRGANASSDRMALFSHIRYNWRVLARYLRRQAPANSLVVVVGDHQPYFAEESSFATPLHVLSRDEALVRRFESAGLVPGLRPGAAADTLHHAGLYSLLVRTITAHDRRTHGRPVAPLPAYHPTGVGRSPVRSDSS